MTSYFDVTKSLKRRFANGTKSNGLNAFSLLTENVKQGLSHRFISLSSFDFNKV